MKKEIYTILSNEENIELIKKIQHALKNNDYEGYDKYATALLLGNSVLIKSYVQKLKDDRLSSKDMFQEFRISLLESAKTFDVNSNVKFITYAVNNFKFKQYDMIRQSAHLTGMTRMRYVNSAIKQLCEQGNYKPTLSQIAEKSGLTEDKIAQLLQAYKLQNLNDVILKKSTKDKDIYLEDTIKSLELTPDEKKMEKHKEDYLHLCMNLLDEKGKIVLDKYLQGYKNIHREITEFKISQSMASRALVKNLEKMKFFYQEKNKELVLLLYKIRKDCKEKNTYSIKDVAIRYNLTVEELFDLIYIALCKYKRAEVWRRIDIENIADVFAIQLLNELNREKINWINNLVLKDIFVGIGNFKDILNVVELFKKENLEIN